MTRRCRRLLFCSVVLAVATTSAPGARLDRDARQGHANALCSEAQQQLLAQLAAQPDNGWWLASRNAFAEVWTPPALRPLNRGQPTAPSRLITAWGGFAWDRNRSALWLFGGGHGDYSGNDVYVWRAATGLWQRASLPSEIQRNAQRIEMAIDGVDFAPAATHPYDSNVFLPHLDRLLSFGGAAYNNGGAWRRTDRRGRVLRTGPYVFDVTRADPWQVGGRSGSHVQREAFYPQLTGAELWQNRDSYVRHRGDDRPPDNHVNGCSAYADENGQDVVYVAARVGGGTALHLFRYQILQLESPQADHWTHVGRFWNGPSDQTACGYDPQRKLFVRTGSHGKPFLFWSLHRPGPANREQIVVPADPGNRFLPLVRSKQLKLRNCGLDFDAVRQRFVLWCGGPQLWALTVSDRAPTAADRDKVSAELAWQITALAARAQPSPSSEVGHGVLGKWAYAPELDVFVALQDGEQGQVWFYKPEQWQPGSCLARAAEDGDKQH